MMSLYYQRLRNNLIWTLSRLGSKLGRLDINLEMSYFWAHLCLESEEFNTNLLGHFCLHSDFGKFVNAYIGHYYDLIWN